MLFSNMFMAVYASEFIIILFFSSIIFLKVRLHFSWICENISPFNFCLMRCFLKT